MHLSLFFLLMLPAPAFAAAEGASVPDLLLFFYALFHLAMAAWLKKRETKTNAWKAFVISAIVLFAIPALGNKIAHYAENYRPTVEKEVCDPDCHMVEAEGEAAHAPETVKDDDAVKRDFGWLSLLFGGIGFIAVFLPWARMMWRKDMVHLHKTAMAGIAATFLLALPGGYAVYFILKLLP